MPTLHERIFEAAHELVRLRGLEFGEGAGHDLEFLARQAADEIEALPPDQRPARVDEAEAAFRAVATAMVRARDSIPGYAERHPGIVGEETLAVARSTASLGWPFD